jgi:putative ABC transport system permease protein
VGTVSEVVSTRTQLIYGNMNWGTGIDGVNVDLPQIRSWQMLYGGFFTPEDVKAANKVIVLGANVSDNLFGKVWIRQTPSFRVRNHVFKVLGVMARKGAGAGGAQNQDDQTFAPYTTVMKKALGSAEPEPHPGVRTDGRRSGAPAKASIEATLRQMHQITARRRGRLHRPDPGRPGGAPHADDPDDDLPARRASRSCRSWLAASAS